MNLYWGTTKNKMEDWFILAASSKEAAESHEYFEEFNNGNAEFV